MHTSHLPFPLSHLSREVKRALLDADVNLKVTNALIEAVKEKAMGTLSLYLTYLPTLPTYHHHSPLCMYVYMYVM